MVKSFGEENFEHLAHEAEIIKQKLAERFRALCQKLHIRNHSRLWHIIETKYTERHRYYHTLNHLHELFILKDEFSKYLQDHGDRVELAIFFHDLIYEVKGSKNTNEIQSARIFAESIPDLDEQTRQSVKTMILRTIDHRCTEKDDLDCQLFCDFDLAILGCDSAKYDTYTMQIRKEYSHVSQALWCLVRSRFLESSYNNNSIFITSKFREIYEEKARNNLKREAAHLRASFYKCSLIARLFAHILVSIILPSMRKISVFTSFSWQALLSPVFFTRSSPCRLTCLVFILSSLCSSSFSQFFTLMAFTVFTLSLLMLIPIFILALDPYLKNRQDKALPSGIAILAGSFHPPHLGHVAILRSLAARHSMVYAVVAINIRKKYTVSADTRKKLLERLVNADPALAGIVVVKIYTDYVWKLALQEKAILYRGIRTWQKDGVAEILLLIQNVFGPVLLSTQPPGVPVQTRFFRSPEGLRYVSSSMIRNHL